MGLEYSVACLRGGLDAPAASRDGMWAYRMNGDTREVLEDVWESLPEPGRVRDEILPLLRDAATAVQEAPRLGRFSEHMDAFEESIRRRLAHLEGYAGCCSGGFLDGQQAARV